MTDWMLYIEQFHFLRPLWLLMIIPAGIVVWALWRKKSAYGSWAHVISPHLLPHLMVDNQSHKNSTPFILLALGWLLASLAMAGPTWQKLPQPVQQKVNAQIILLDLSLSMYAKDIAPSRLVRTRLKLRDILEQTQEGLTALIVYAGSTHVVTPLTDDSKTILSMVNSLSPEIMPVKGSNPNAAVERALEILQQGGFSEGRLLLMTDNVPNDFVSAAKSTLPAGVTLSILGVGTTGGAPIELPDGSFVKTNNGNIVIPKLDIAELKLAAKELGGRFSTLSTTDDDINYLLAEDSFIDAGELKDTDREFDVWDETGHWIVLFILPIAALGYRRGWLGAWLMPGLLLLSGISAPQTSYALSWQDLWQTKDQQGKQLFDKNQFDEAATRFSDPGWKGYSYYQTGDYEKAEQAFARALVNQENNATSHYNLGNAQAKLKKFDDAIASYEKALAINPEMEDAKSNLELIKNLKEQEQQSSDNQSNQDEENEQQEDNSESSNNNQNEGDQSNQQEGDQQSDQSQQDNANSEQQSTQSEQQQSAESEQPSQAGSNQQNDSSNEQESEEDTQAQGQPTKPEEGDEQSDPTQSTFSQNAEGISEDQQAMEQWLRRIPDDPGGLLRRKFLKETQNQQQNSSGESQW